MSGAELMKFFDDYCERKGFTQAEAREKGIWWAMFYRWKEGGWWTEYDD